MKISISPREQVLVIVALVVVLGAMFYFLMYQPTMEHVKEQEVRCMDLESQIQKTRATKSALDSTYENHKVVLEGIDMVVSAYYPFIPPQYYVDLLRQFSDEQELIIDRIELKTPSAEKEEFGPVGVAVVPFKALSIASNTGSPAAVDSPAAEDSLAEEDSLAAEDSLTEEDSLAAEDSLVADDSLTAEDSLAAVDSPMNKDGVKLIGAPGVMGVHEVTFVLKGGETKQYLSVLESINKIDYPIYVSKYELLINKADNEFQAGMQVGLGSGPQVVMSNPFEVEEGLEMRITVKPIFIDRFTEEQKEKVEGKFTFEVLPSANSEDNFKKIVD